ncbi:uncharacterized protein L201_000804 [Kwoniella dendrophila CBS 6074]|uniref:Ubiquitin-like protease family profile domain-containing protein n=1 Tax=Kwoniella dendrophila CBS 6074 TaxID=1295534 RepID=A0AAX4JKL6_9TREE
MSSGGTRLVKDLLVHTAKTQTKDKPWDLFLFASEQNDVELGRMSITVLYPKANFHLATGYDTVLQGLYTNHHTDSGELWIKKLKPSWQLALFHAILEHGHILRGCHWANICASGLRVEQGDLSSRFNPAEFEEQVTTPTDQSD